ncbi:gamma-glutamyl-gamma-aminobutyrate hydrolase family protein [Dysgonomonas sp. 511]|uniref:gamma-glutamyl-gamma-aminobutyrate hydrolase family protein n=1 Tax=Dysgonomonas sp. 511 TaxID=2302930 RepID=UPI0013D07D7A|nr:gamma-glutamyl-gamma-aminobutyrate hydrolase family protein [Dysgonomonas sp. 511]NDV77378.1 gamma-glutamyl-gamma-aminobutyrate hydrolase family protein [Dysgonomonas sp. 511]
MNFKLITISIALLFCIIAKSQNNPSLPRLHEQTDKEFVDLRAKKNPLIGVSATRGSKGGSVISGTYIQAILKAGGTPIVIPVMTDGVVLRDIVKQLDGLIITGGDDIAPSYYNEKEIPKVNEIDSIRDIYDFVLLKLAADRNIPILGICRGMQLINVAYGGSLYQDIPLQAKSDIEHKQKQPRDIVTHDVSIDAGSKLASILGVTNVHTNSYHHQGVKKVAPGFRATAKASDGMVEAIEAYPNRNIIAVEWHPEVQAAAGDTTMLKLFSFFMGEADLFRRAKELHKQILSVDTHCDTPLEFKKAGFDIGKRESNQVNLPKMEEGMLDAIFFAAYTAQGLRDKVSSQKTVDKIEGLIKGIHSQVEKNKDLCEIAYTADDLRRIKEEGKKAIFIGIENGYGIGKDIANIARFKKMGVNYITLCHTKDNDICDTSSKSNHEWNGLSPFGKQVVKEMNRLGVMIDVSHAGEKTFWDVIELSEQPIIASHSSAQALCYHDRNLTDKQMQAITKNGGVVQICLVDLFINKDRKKASLQDAIDHIDHAVKVAGIDHVGIASDFDGGGGLIGCDGSNDMINITMKLMERGYTNEQIGKIWGGNFLRVMNTVQQNAKDTTTN